MEFSEALSELWVLVGELLEALVGEFQRLTHRIEQTPHFSTWVIVWLGLFWLCLRWIHIAKDANDRRIYEAAEARLSSLIDDAKAPLATGLDEVNSNEVISADRKPAQNAYVVST